MKAIVQDEYGSADMLRFEDVDVPIAGNDEVLLRVGAASAFIGDWHVMTGTPYAIRLVSGLRASRILRGRPSGFHSATIHRRYAERKGG